MEDKKGIRKYFSFINKIKEKMKTNKLYLFSFIVTVAFLGFLIIKDAYDREQDNNKSKDNIANVVTDSNIDENVNIKDYIGYYSKEYNLSKSVNINNCDIKSYKIDYYIDKNKSIYKYFENGCLGTYLVYKDVIKYNYTDGARYLGSNKENYLFSNSGLKILNGDTFNKDEDITSIKEKKLDKNVKLYFNDKSIIMRSYDNIYLLKSTLLSNITSDYINNGGELEKRVYSSDGINFKFIVFSNNERVNCYNDRKETDVVYNIYSVKYDKENDKFLSINKEKTRYYNDSCNIFNEDLDDLQK